jgi:DNA-binding CsgD family transcriptional regulator
MSYTFPDQGLVALISEASFDPAKWTTVCQKLSTLVGGYGALMFPLGPELAKMGLPHSETLKESFEHYINDDWHTRDLRFNAIDSMRKRGFATDADCISYSAIAKSDYYQDFLRPNKLKWFAGIGVGEGANFWVLSVQQTIDKEPFNPSDIEKLLSYRNALNDAANISRQLGFAKITSAASVMEQHDRAVIALAFDGRVVHLSTTAQSYVGKAFNITNGRLQARQDRDLEPLESLIASLTNRNIANSRSRPVPLSNGPEKSPLVVYGTLLPEQQRQTFYQATALLIIVDPARDQNISGELMMDYFDITKAEAKLATTLLQGKSVETHSIENAISPVTSRNHLQRLLRKTDSHSKAELIVKLNNIKPF